MAPKCRQIAALRAAHFPLASTIEHWIPRCLVVAASLINSLARKTCFIGMPDATCVAKPRSVSGPLTTAVSCCYTFSLMRVAQTTLVLWMCFVFAVSGLDGLVLCIGSDGRIAVAREDTKGCAPRRQDDESHCDGDCYSHEGGADRCVDIPLSVTELQTRKVGRTLKAKIAGATRVCRTDGPSQSRLGLAQTAMRSLALTERIPPLQQTAILLI